MNLRTARRDPLPIPCRCWFPRSNPSGRHRREESPSTPPQGREAVPSREPSSPRGRSFRSGRREVYPLPFPSKEPSPRSLEAFSTSPGPQGEDPEGRDPPEGKREPLGADPPSRSRRRPGSFSSLGRVPRPAMPSRRPWPERNRSPRSDAPCLRQPESVPAETRRRA